MVFPIVGGTQSTGYDIDNSGRFGGDRELTITPGSAGNRRVFTFSCWVKRSGISNRGVLFRTGGSGDSQIFEFIFHQNDYIMLGLATVNVIETNALFRDPSAWYHIVLAVDTTDGTASNRVKLYVNGQQNTSWSVTNLPSQNHDYGIGRASTEHTIGASDSGGDPFDGYIADVHYIDGIQKAASDFGEYNDNGVWIPKKYTGSYGTNGFFLEFKQTGTSQNSSGIGADTSGNDNHMAVNNLAAKDVVTDTPTNNFATLNPMAGNSQLFANGYFFGNTRVNSNVVGVGDNNYLMSISTIGVTSGKWYAEFKPTGNLYSSGTDSSSLIGVGSGIYKAGNGNHNTAIGGFTHWWLDHDDDRVVVDGNLGNTNMNSGTHVQANDIIGVYLNCDTTTPTVTFHKNGSALGGATNSPYNVRRTGSYNIGTNNPIFFMPVVRYGGGSDWGRFECNFGNPPNLPSSGNTDANGYGNFEYSPTLSGTEYYALCTKNLAEYG